MNPREQAEQLSTDDVVALIERNAQQDERIADLEAQLDWLKRQLFGPRSEKLLHPDSSHQPTLGEGMLSAVQEHTGETTTVAAHTRHRKKPSREPGEPRLRFDDDVPVEEIVVEDESLADLDPGSYALVDYKVSYRLVQRPGIY